MNRIILFSGALFFASCTTENVDMTEPQSQVTLRAHDGEMSSYRSFALTNPQRQPDVPRDINQVAIPIDTVHEIDTTSFADEPIDLGGSFFGSEASEVGGNFGDAKH